MPRQSLAVPAAFGFAGGRRTPSGKSRVYQRDYAGSGSAWRPKTFERPPRGERRFLGGFVNEPVSLRFNKLPAHDYIRVRFDLLILLSWDGNGLTGHGPHGDVPVGPDFLNIAVRDGPLLFAQSFSNILDDRGFQTPTKFQTYPSPVPGDCLPARTGACENNTLGYRYEMGPGFDMDAVYRVTLLFPHNAETLQLDFGAPNLQTVFAPPDLPDEYWGLDAVEIEALSSDTLARLNTAAAKDLLAIAADPRDSLAAADAFHAFLAGGTAAQTVLRKAVAIKKVDWAEIDRLALTTDNFASKSADSLRAFGAIAELPIRRVLRHTKDPRIWTALQTVLNHVTTPITDPALRTAAVALRALEIIAD